MYIPSRRLVERRETRGLETLVPHRVPGVHQLGGDAAHFDKCVEPDLLPAEDLAAEFRYAGHAAMGTKTRLISVRKNLLSYPSCLRCDGCSLSLAAPGPLTITFPSSSLTKPRGACGNHYYPDPRLRLPSPGASAVTVTWTHRQDPQYRLPSPAVSGVTVTKTRGNGYQAPRCLG